MDNLKRLLSQAERHTHNASSRYNKAVADSNAAGDNYREILGILNRLRSKSRSNDPFRAHYGDSHRDLPAVQRQTEHAQLQRKRAFAAVGRYHLELKQAEADEVVARENIRKYVATNQPRTTGEKERKDKPAHGRRQPTQQQQRRKQWEQYYHNQRQQREQEWEQQWQQWRQQKQQRQQHQQQQHRRPQEKPSGGQRPQGDGPSSPHPPNTNGPNTITREDISAFHATAQSAFSDYSTIQTFPDPPSTLCGQVSCLRDKPNRALLACSCNIKTVFSGFEKSELKTARLQWHPDKFAKCPEELRDEFQKKAQEVFVVVDAMYQVQKL